MTCGGCENAVTFTLKELKGVQEVRASHAANTVNVTFDEGTVTPAVLKSAIEGLGYTVAP